MTFIVADPSYMFHRTGFGHPERPERYAAICQALEEASLKTPENTLKPRSAVQSEILLCHTQGYIAKVEEEIRVIKKLGIADGRYSLSTGDTQFCPDSLQIALLSAGGVLTAIDAVMQNKARNAFCIVRPPGHHACSNKGMGFCIYNNVAIGARYAQKKYGLERVLIADWDVHHGNGTQEIFYEDPSVFYFSTHQSPLYPETGSAEESGEGKGLGTTLNCPISASPESRLKVIEAFEVTLVEAMKNFKPDLVLVSAGFDAHEWDPLGGFNLTGQDFSTLTEIVLGLAYKYSKGRLVSVLEGGYHLQGIALAAKAHVSTLCSEHSN